MALRPGSSPNHDGEEPLAKPRATRSAPVFRPELAADATGLVRSVLPVAAMNHRGETTLWTCAKGVRCVLLPYDDTRYQLKLLREIGTIKADLFVGYAEALAASRRWREEFDVAPCSSFVMVSHSTTARQRA